MKQNLLLFFFLLSGLMLKAQDIDKTTAMQLVIKNNSAIGLSSEDLTNALISSAYSNANSGIQMVYLQQGYKGIPVYNQIMPLAFRGGIFLSKAGEMIPALSNVINQKNGKPSVSPADAVKAALANKKLTTFGNPVALNFVNGKYEFGKMGISFENITAELLWVPMEDGKAVKLAWQVYVVPTNSSDYWLIRVDASNKKIISESNLTVYCNWNPAKKESCKVSHDHEHGAPTDQPATFNQLFDFTKFSRTEDRTAASPAIVNGATYRVVPFPAESPKHTGGAHALRTDPWTAAPGNATSLKWHSNGTTDYNITRGNNVWAKEDLAANNGTNGAAATSSTADPLTFNNVPDYLKPPTQTTPVPNQQFNITNLFYWINIFHDIMYQYGFDEAAGNFQANNQGRGGAQNDFVFGDAQNGNYTTNNQDNANFATPPDGQSGRMQMFLWDTASVFTVNSPASVAGGYTSFEGNFSPNNKLVNVGPVTAQVVFYNDAAATTTEACTPNPANSVTGKIALINRGNCNFTVKVKNAQLAGAVGAIIINNVATPPYVLMGGDDNTITIPAVNISQADGLLLSAQVVNNLNVTLGAALLDGDVDNGIIVHEHAHGISTRLTGGPAQVTCLGNAEHMGEGISDYYTLMLTQDWANSNLNSGFTTPRGIGTYVINQQPSGLGIRTKHYCTDFAVNDLVYSASLPANPLQHNRGEIWCATLWDMTWNIINQVGTINPNLYNAAGTGGNSIALKLVTEGLKLQPCSPGFIDARNAILQADQNLYNGAYNCAIREAFRRRGMGTNASQGSGNSVTDQVTDFGVITACSCSSVTAVTPPANTSACAGSAATFTVTATGTTPAYQWQVSTDGGTNYTDITGATSATLSLPAVTAAQNNYQYRVVISNTCPSTVTTTAGILTVSNPASITAQPTSTTVCSGANAAFTIAASGTGVTYQWQLSTDGGVTFTDIAGQTATTLSLNSVTSTMNANQYRVRVISCDPAGISSSIVTLTVNAVASITTQPTNITACDGANATISVVAAGTSNNYQWQVSTDGGASFTNVAGATSASLTLNGVTAALNNNVYHVLISNSCTPTAITSANSTLTVTNTAVITSQPVAATVCAGANTTFTAVAAGSSYQWQVSTDGGTTYTDVAGATGTTLNLTAVTAAMNNNRYKLVIVSCGSANIETTPVLLTVNVPATFTTQPANAAICVGGDVTFTGAAGGTSPAYQWNVSTDGGTTYTAIAGANAATLTVTAVTSSMNNNLYQLTISNTCTPGANSTAATLTVNPATEIATQPNPVVTCEGTNASFSVSASNATGATYQWQVSTDGGVTFANIAGATSDTYSLTGVAAGLNNNLYRANVTGCGTATSAGVLLIVNPLPTVTISNSTTLNLASGMSTVLTATSNAPSATISWYNNGVLQPTLTGNNITVGYSQLGAYNAIATDANGCVSTASNILTVADSIVNIAFIYPNPNNGVFRVRFNGYSLPGTFWKISMYDAKGSRVMSQSYATITSYQVMDVDVRKLSKGVYVLVLSDASGITLGTGKVLIQ